ncbi:restriction endonuclease subunit S [Microbacterium sp. MMO-10]|uniref:restriction endonuclease subunit S n=1 Tax=Microbacterium sp. MMO-10 TaxID=3081272 RepID=UPI0030179713
MREGWREVTLGEVCKITKGSSPTLKTPPGQYPLIVTGPTPSSSDEFQFDGEAVCVPLVSSTGHGHASLKRVHYASGQFAVANIIAACLPHPSSGVNTPYLFHYLQHLKDDLIVTRMKGTANVSLSISNLSHVPVALPPVNEQRRIVDLIAAVDDAIRTAESEAMISTTLLNSVLDQFETAAFARVGTIASISSGASWAKADVRSSMDGDVSTVLTIANTKPDGSVAGEPTYVAGLTEKTGRLTPTSIVAIRTNGNHERIGNVYRVPEEYAGAAVSAFQLIIEPVEQADSAFLFWMLSRPSMQSRITAASSGSTGLGNIAASKLREMSVPWPEKPEARVERAEVFQAHWAAAEAARATADSLKILRSNLLTVLLSGEHEIPASYDELLNLDTERGTAA